MEQIRLFQVAEVQVSYKPNFKASERPRITCSRDSFNILLQQWDHNKIEYQEQFKVMLLNRGNKVLGILDVSTGGMAGTLADPKIIFSTALKCLASGVVLAHNHPSGNLKPSQADINLTRKLKEGGALLEIAILDHLIVTTDGYLSFADDGLI
jgi:DNA repair protein RadC